jgi:hypothetical protein
MFAGRVFKFEILSHTEGLFTIVRQRGASSAQINNVRRKGMKNSTFAGLLCFVFVLFLSEPSLSQASVYYYWPAYSPTLEYDYVDEYGEISPPTQVRNDGVTGVAGTYIDGWWCFRWGANKNSLVTSAAWIPMLQRFNEDFSYITDVMRWPRDKRAREGYYSTIYLYGSGLSTDSEPNTALGGWQSSAGGYPMVLASYYPVYSFNPSCTYGDRVSQRGAMIHEGIHCILSSMPGCYNSCWFNEGGNTWLQGTMEGQRSGNFSSMGWLSGGAAIAPFMPIECYSGWLQDGSFGGPCAQGVNRYEGGQQICTWRNFLGGTQYGECFPHALEVILGPKSIAWLWRNCHYSGRVLQDLAQAPGGLGDAQTRRLIQEFRARQAFCDFGQWSYAFRQLLNNNWGRAIEEEWSPYWIDVAIWNATCYVSTTQVGSVLTPETRTLPGWSGGNQIPLTINPSATEAVVTFNPIGANMSCQLVYRDTSGNIHYGAPVSSGVCSIPLANVMNNVIVAVICNTDYIYNGESTRTAHYNYTLTMGAGITGKASITGINSKWYDYNPSSYTITASAGDHGTINPSGNVSVSAGSNKTFTFNPNTDYDVNEVILNGLPIGTLDSYTFNNVRGNHTISVTFRIPGSEVKVNVQAEGFTLSEGSGTQKFIVSRNSSAGDLEVGFQMSGSAVETEDYTISCEGNTVTIPSGQTSVEVEITPVDDSNSEGDKTVIIELAESENYTLGTQTTALIYLLDDELKGDIWCDGCVNFIDLSFILYYWLNEEPDPVADIYPDEVVNFKDFAVFAKDWLVCDPLRSNIVSPFYWEYVPSSTPYIDIEVEAVSSVGSVTEVIFYANGKEIGRDTNGADGFTYRWEDFGRGQAYDLVAVAFDNNGNMKVSQPIPIATE